MGIRIGELAEISGCQVVTIRYYEKEGLLPLPDRTKSNYRLYNENDVERLHFIRRCRMHGMTLSEIRQLLAFKDNPTVSCDWINTLVEKHIAKVEQQIASLKHLKKHLQALLHQCQGGRHEECGIIATLTKCGDCPCCGSSCSLHKATEAPASRRSKSQKTKETPAPNPHFYA